MQNVGGVLGIGFEFLGIVGLFTGAGIFLHNRFGGGGLYLFACIIAGVAAGLWHMIRRVRSLEIEMRAQKKMPVKETPEDHLRKLDEMSRALDDLTHIQKQKDQS